MKPESESKPSLESDEEIRAAEELRAALEQGLAQITTPEEAEHSLNQLEQKQEWSEGEIAEGTVRPSEQAAAVDEARAEALPREKASETLAQTAVEVARAGEGNRDVVDRAIAEVGAVDAPRVRGRNLLRQALIKRLKPLDAVDTILFVQINGLPHPAWLDRSLSRLSWIFTGGHGWLLVLAICGAVERCIRWRTFLGLMPAIWAATYLVEGPIKKTFRRKRPFSSIVRSIVVGRKPGNYSFPSGHSAAAFAGAYLFARQFPRGRSAFFLLAGLIGFSRVFLGAHYPGDVVSGGIAGGVLARFFQGMGLSLFRRIKFRMGERSISKAGRK